MRKYDEKFLRSLEHDFKLQILNFFEILKSQKISEKGILIPLNKQSKKIKNYKNLNNVAFNYFANLKNDEIISNEHLIFYKKFSKMMDNHKNITRTLFSNCELYFLKTFIVYEEFKNLALTKFLFLNDNKLKKIIKMTKKESVDDSHWQIYFDRETSNKIKYSILQDLIKDISHGGFEDRVKVFRQLKLEPPQDVSRAMLLLNMIRNDVVHNHSIIQNKTYSEIEKFYQDKLDNKKSKHIALDTKHTFKKILRNKELTKESEKKLEIGRTDFTGLFLLMFSDFFHTSLTILEMTEYNFDEDSKKIEISSNKNSMIFNFLLDFIYDGIGSYYVETFYYEKNNQSVSDLTTNFFFLEDLRKLIIDRVFIKIDGKRSFRYKDSSKIDRNLICINIAMIESMIVENVNLLEKEMSKKKNVGNSKYKGISERFSMHVLKKYPISVEKTKIFKIIDYEEQSNKYEDLQFKIAINLICKNYTTAYNLLCQCEDLDDEHLINISGWHISRDFAKRKDFLYLCEKKGINLPNENVKDIFSDIDLNVKVKA